MADRLAQKAGDAYLSTEQVLLAMFADGAVAGMLKACGVTEQALKAGRRMTRSGETVSDPNAEDRREALEKYTSI
jgi:ATP-dependent Clp protease ATP-binding subunit ClpB